jgi:hypothetical protein
MQLVGHMVLEHLHEATLANASFTAHEHHVPVTNFDLLPTFQEKGDFGFSPHQRGQASRHRHIETPPGSTFLEDAVHVDRLSHTSQWLAP